MTPEKRKSPQIKILAMKLSQGWVSGTERFHCIGDAVLWILVINFQTRANLLGIPQNLSIVSIVKPPRSIRDSFGTASSVLIKEDVLISGVHVVFYNSLEYNYVVGTLFGVLITLDVLIEGLHSIDWSTITVRLQHKYILQFASCLHAQQVNMDLTRLYSIVTINKIIILLETCVCILLYVDPGKQGHVTAC